MRVVQILWVNKVFFLKIVSQKIDIACHLKGLSMAISMCAHTNFLPHCISNSTEPKKQIAFILVLLNISVFRVYVQCVGSDHPTKLKQFFEKSNKI